MKKTDTQLLIPTKKMINDAKDLSKAQKNIFKEEILQEITENFMDKILAVVNQNIQRCTQEISRHQE
jgi:ABC-type transporter MlaC component